MNQMPSLQKNIKNRNQGMYRLALKMLFRDRTRYLVLLGAFAFSTLLVTQQAGIFCGIMHWTSSSIRLLKTPLWVMDKNVQQVEETKPMEDTDADKIRSVPGVAWAVPIFYNIVKAKLSDGDYKNAMLVGLDSNTLIGRPAQMLEGKIEDIRLPDAILIDDLAVKRFHLKMGDTMELNDKHARIVGVFKAERSFTGNPYFITTFDRAVFFAPPTRKVVSFVLAAPMPNQNPLEVVKSIEERTGLRARTEDQFSWDTIWWFIRNTGIPIAFGTTVLLGMIVGIAVSGQTFYAFVIENLKNLATFKAMGLNTRLLGKMLLLQSFTVGLLGYAIGSGFGALFGWMALTKREPPFFVPWQLILFTFLMVCIICLFACYLGWRRVKNLEAGMVFRG
ncbi:MAG: FtsX-like permease family protein [Deltaproteobacteria bacterium]|nr:FtsX-like permease family protein [Deltaproteobacteria bacterium]